MANQLALDLNYQTSVEGKSTLGSWKVVVDIEQLDCIPTPESITNIYVDFETTGLNPWHEDTSIIGICITWDEHDTGYYIPTYDAYGKRFIKPSIAFKWLEQQFLKSKYWINHNVKFDANMWLNCNDGKYLPFQGTYIDTIVGAKILNSDRMNYALDLLMRDWLKIDISKYEKAIQPFINGTGVKKKYSEIPVDIIGEYGCHDVLATRLLFKYIFDRMPEELCKVWGTEIEYTDVLLDMEQSGLCVDVDELHAMNKTLLNEMSELEEGIEKTTGQRIRPNTNADCFDLLCVKNDLPVLSYTKAGKPSFDADALKQYLIHPEVEKLGLKPVVQQCLTYRKKQTLNSLFVEAWLKLQSNSYLHSDYNQIVRTGRSSARQPNAMQLNKEAKKLIHPDENCVFVSMDYSQVEFRLIVHYIQDENALLAYAEDPYTDFHQWVADMCGIKRTPAKTVNFGMAYGSGKERVLSMLAGNMELMEELKDEPNFHKACKQRAEQVYEEYHATLPSLKPMSYRAAKACRMRGYVFNIAGRRRHLPTKASHIAFNTIIQSSASDILKERTVAVAASRVVQEAGWVIKASVHDEILWQAPESTAYDMDVVRHVVDIMENPSFDLRVPIKVSVGWSDMGGNWCDIPENDRDSYLQYRVSSKGRKVFHFS